MKWSCVLCFALMLLITSPAVAEPVLFTFTGSGEAALSGGFILDDSASWSVSPSADGGVLGVLASPLQAIWGSIGEYSFIGTPSLYVSDRPEFLPDGSDTVGSDYWIIRSSLSGPLVNGLAPMFLNLFVYTSTAGINGLGLSPPPLSSNPFDFQFTLAYSDSQGQFASVDGGNLLTLTRVPEPGVFALLVAAGTCVSGGVALRQMRVQRRRSRKTHIADELVRAEVDL